MITATSSKHLYLWYISRSCHTHSLSTPVIGTVLDTAGFKGEHAIFYRIAEGDSVIDEGKKTKTSRIQCIKPVLIPSQLILTACSQVGISVFPQGHYGGGRHRCHKRYSQQSWLPKSNENFEIMGSFQMWHQSRFYFRACRCTWREGVLWQDIVFITWKEHMCSFRIFTDFFFKRKKYLDDGHIDD